MYFLFHTAMEFVQIKSMIVTNNGKESEKECTCVYIYVCSRITLMCICNKHNTEINYTPIKKTYKEKKRKRKNIILPFTFQESLEM